jgi:hypothetical protein
MLLTGSQDKKEDGGKEVETGDGIAGGDESD